MLKLFYIFYMSSNTIVKLFEKSLGNKIVKKIYLIMDIGVITVYIFFSY